MTQTIIIGVDPGVNTGFAKWDRVTQQLLTVSTMKIHMAMKAVEYARDSGNLHMVVFEDARLRKWHGHADARMARSGAGIREGVGSVKRDCSIWQDFLSDLGVPFLQLKPAPGTTKWDAERFERVTGWTGRTSNHARDAACLVIGRK